MSIQVKVPHRNQHTGKGWGYHHYSSRRSRRNTHRSGNFVLLFADSGWKYLSTGLWTKDLSQFEEEIEGKI